MTFLDGVSLGSECCHYPVYDFINSDTIIHDPCKVAGL